MEGVNDLFKKKNQHYYYLERLFKKVSMVFAQLAEMVTDLDEIFGVIEDECVIKRSDCVYKLKNYSKFDRKKAVPFAMFIKDAIDKLQKENPEYDILDCISRLKTYWDDSRYKSIREMYEYIASELLEKEGNSGGKISLRNNLQRYS